VIFKHDLFWKIESWRGFAERLQPPDKEEFLKMLQKLYDYSNAINARLNHSRQSQF